MFVRRHYLFEIRPHNALTLGGVPVAGSEAARMINEKVEALGEAQAAAAIATIKDRKQPPDRKESLERL